MLKKFIKSSVIFILIITIFASSVFANGQEIVFPEPAFTLSSNGDISQALDYSMVTDDNRIYFKVDGDGAYELTIPNAETGTNETINVFLVNDGSSVAFGSTSDGSFDINVKDLQANGVYGYYIELTDEQLKSLQNGDQMTITGKRVGDIGAKVIGEKLDMAQDKVDDKFENIEYILAKAVSLLAKGLNWLISTALGRTLTIDNIVFNEYDVVKLNFFSTGIDGLDVATSETTIVDDLKGAINSVYAIFQDIALTGYLIILVYIGIRMVLSSTSAGKKAGYKETFWSWLTGIMILFFFPYVMKYTILLNEAFVIQIGASRSQESIVGSSKTAPIDTSGGFMGTDFEDAIDFSSGRDYMSRIGQMADTTGKLGVSIAYLILTWQLVMLIIYYYRRAFITAFLIMIFPLIAFTYVWDKLNDGKSQALSSWTREFAIGVFVQSFHAIIFVFVTNTIYSTISNDSADFILLMIAASFMFTGEEILKQILAGGSSEVHGSLAQSTGKVLAATGAAMAIGKSVAHNVVGKDGLVRGTIASTQNLRKTMLLTRKDGFLGLFGTRNFDKLASNERKERAVAGMLAGLQKDGEPPTPISPEIRKAAEVVDTLNNIDKKSPEEVAKALEELKRMMAERKNMDPEKAKQFDEIMRQSKLTPAQLDRLDKGMVLAATMAANGEDPVKIRQTLRMEVEIAMGGDGSDIEIGGFFDDKVQRVHSKEYLGGKIKIKNKENLSGHDVDRRNTVADKLYQATLINMKQHGASRAVNRGNVNEAWNRKVQETTNAYNNIKFAGKQSSNVDTAAAVEQTKQKRENRTQGLIDQYTSARGVAPADIPNNQMAAMNSCAKSIAVLEQLTSGETSAFEAYKAIDNLDKNGELANAMLKLSNIETDIESLKYLLAKKIQTENPGRDGRQFKATAQKNYEAARKWAKSTVESMEARAAQVTASEGEAFGVNRVSPDTQNNNLSDSTVRNEFTQSGPNRNVYFDPTAAMYGGMHYNAVGSYADTGSYKQYTDAGGGTQAEGTDLRKRYSVPDDPVVNIMNIIAAAQGNNASGSIPNFDAIANATSDSAGASGIIDSKMERVREMNQRERMSSQEFAEQTLKDERYDVSRITKAFRSLTEEPPEYEQPTFNGYTLDELKKVRNAEFKNIATNFASMGAGLTVGTLATAAGAAGGMAFTQDGMPIEEVFVGASAGLVVSDQVSTGLIPKASGATERAKQKSKIESKVAKRLKANEKAKEEELERVKSRQAFADAENATRGQADQKLTINMVSASLYTTADNQLYARVFVNADNAEYISVNEQAIFRGWESYQEEVSYEFFDNDSTKPHDIYVYVKDRSGNIKSARIVGAKI